MQVDRFYWLQFGFTLVSWSCLLIAVAAARAAEWKTNRVGSWEPRATIGALLSHGLYLWHHPVEQVLRIVKGTTQDTCGGRVNLADCRFGDHHRIAGISPVVQIVLEVGLSFAIAVPTYFLVERRALALKDHFQVGRPSSARQREEHLG